jgi:hypothetical protein
VWLSATNRLGTPQAQKCGGSCQREYNCRSRVTTLPVFSQGRGETAAEGTLQEGRVDRMARRLHWWKLEEFDVFHVMIGTEELSLGMWRSSVVSRASFNCGRAHLCMRG